MVYHSLDDPSHVHSCTLCRTEKLGKVTLHHALNREVIWPSNKNPPVIQNTGKSVSLDEAFSSIFQFMKVTCSFCKRYYRGCCHCTKIPADFIHCDRFHLKPVPQPAPAKKITGGTQDLRIVADPGSYSVTTGTWGNCVQQTHVVKVDHGQVVSMDFCI